MNPLPPTFSGWTPLPPTPVAGPSQTVPPPVSGAGTSASAATNITQARRNKRRPQAAYDILGDFYHHVTDRPTKQQRLELAQQVRRIPGCEDYKSTDVAGYFSRKRQSMAARPPTDEARHPSDTTAPLFGMESVKILCPSLAKGPKSLQRLEVLLADDPNPSDEIATIWAERIGYRAKAYDILTYAKLLRARKPHSSPPPSSIPSSMPALPPLPPFSAPRTQVSHLPTPSTSPEPTSLPTSPVIQSSGTGGRIMTTASVKEEEDELESDKDMELDSDTNSEVEVPLSAMVGHTSFALASRVQDDLVSSLHKMFAQSREPPENVATAPRSFAQFSQWMGPQEQAATDLLQEISKGTYVHLGLKPGASSAPPPGI